MYVYLNKAGTWHSAGSETVQGCQPGFEEQSSNLYTEIFQGWADYESQELHSRGGSHEAVGVF